MTNLPPNSNSDTGKDTGFKPNRGSPPGIPRWLKVLGIIFIGSLGGHIPLMP